MGLFASGKPAAIAAIKAAVLARITAQSDGTLKLNTPSLREWLHQQAEEIIASDVALANRDAARGVLATIDATAYVSRLEGIYAPSNWTPRPEYPTAKSIASSSAFVSASAQAMAEMEALALDLQKLNARQTAHGFIKCYCDFTTQGAVLGNDQAV
jgi:hypothetical protein